MDQNFCFSNHILVKDISLMYTSITKVASTVMRYSIAKHLKMISDTDSKENLDLAVSKYNELRLGTLQNKMLAKNRLLILRDPAERIVSVFLDRVVKKKINLKKLCKENLNINIDYKTFNFDNFLNLLPNLYPLEKHFVSQSKYTLPNFQYNLIYNISEFKELVNTQKFYEITKLKIVDIDTFSNHHLSKNFSENVINANELSINTIYTLIKKNKVPYYKNFLNSQNIKIIEKIYYDDYNNFNKYFK